MLSKKDYKGEDDDDDGPYTLTPRTEESYKKIDAEYARVMQNPAAAGTRVSFSL